MQTALLVKQLRSEFAGPFELNLGRGTCVAITGPSGSGKSLFLRMIADLDPNEGEIWLNGRERASMRAPEWRKQAILLLILTQVHSHISCCRTDLAQPKLSIPSAAPTDQPPSGAQKDFSAHYALAARMCVQERLPRLTPVKSVS
jgi:ABC-type iron transport system FetAB ATPase subunit